MGRIKILHIIKSLGRGGAEMLLPETLKLHDKSKFDFHYIYFLPWKNQMVDSLMSHGGTVSCISANNNIQLILKWRQVRDYVRKHDIQLIHAHLPWAGIIAKVVGKLTNTPVIYTEHNKQERYHWITRLMNLTTMNWLTAIVAVSEDVAVSIRRYKPRLRPASRVILNGVDIQKFAPGIFNGKEIRKALNIPEAALVIGTIAVFRFQKRLDLWMEIAQTILTTIPSAYFIMVGDGPLKNMLIEKRKSLGLEERIHLAGLQTEVRPYIAAFDIYMMTSVFEGLPIALLETMASGCAVVSTDAGGIKEVIQNDINGMLCSVRRPEILAELITSLNVNVEKRKQLGISARRRIEETFSMEKMVKELEALYQEYAHPDVWDN